MQKLISPIEFYRAIRDSQLTGLCGYSKEVVPSLEIICFYSFTIQWSGDFFIKYSTICHSTFWPYAFLHILDKAHYNYKRMLSNFQICELDSSFSHVIIHAGPSCDCCWCRAKHIRQGICKIFLFLIVNCLL